MKVRDMDITMIHADIAAKRLGRGYRAASWLYRSDQQAKGGCLVMKGDEIVFRGHSWSSCMHFVKSEIKRQKKEKEAHGKENAKRNR